MEKPKKIYKYQAFTQYSLRNVKNNQIFFNNPLNFNDPFDTFQEVKIKDLSCKAMKDTFFGQTTDKSIFELLENGHATSEESEKMYFILSKSMKSFKIHLLTDLKIDVEKNLNSTWNELINLVDSEILQKIICQSFYKSFNEIVKTSLNSIKEQGLYDVSVSCFSERNDNMLMWSHYGDSHKGFCLEFDTDYAPFTKMFPIRYSEEVPEIDADKILENENNDLEVIKAYLLSKYIDWEYEKEWRILHKEKLPSYCYKTNALTGIYFGTKANFTDFEILSTIIKGHHSNCQLYMMDKVPGKFKVVPRKINYSTFSEAKTIVANQLLKHLADGERNVDRLVKYVKINTHEEHIRTIVEAVIDDI